MQDNELGRKSSTQVALEKNPAPSCTDLNQGARQRLDSFTKELIQLKNETYAQIDHSDYRHLRKIMWINRTFKTIALLFIWVTPNPVSMICFAIALSGQWSMVQHHISHGGYDRISTCPKRFHSKRFAKGWRRYIDWLDWIYPPAWEYEHNIAHHFNTNEREDPDNVFENAKMYRNSSLPLWLNAICFYLQASTWKFSYYAINTMSSLQEKRKLKHGMPYSRKAIAATIIHCYIPYFSLHFVLFPLLFFPLGSWAVLSVFINRLVAEILTNLHTFMIIVPNHAGEDLKIQNHHFQTKEEFFLSQLHTTCNYQTGGFWKDYFSGYLNYQIEHHLFPDLPMSKYVEIQPKIKALCKKYHLPYIQESVFVRNKKLFQVAMGQADLHYEDIKPSSYSSA